jgi:hypothetical protein
MREMLCVISHEAPEFRNKNCKLKLDGFSLSEKSRKFELLSFESDQK